MKKQELLNILLDLGTFSPEKFRNFLSKKNKRLLEVEEQIRNGILLIGEVKLEDKNNLGVFVVEWSTGKASKREKLKLAKEILSNSDFDLALIVFTYDYKNFELDYVEKIYEAPHGKAWLSLVCKKSFSVKEGKLTKSFIQKMIELKLETRNSIRKTFYDYVPIP